MAAGGNISDDLLREIFLRLPSPKALVHAALACKAWLRAASDAAFLRRFHALHPLPHLLGFLFIHPSSAVNHSAPFFVPAAARWSDVIAAGDFSLSFLPGGGLSADWEIHDCHGGRILLRNANTEELIVADPLSQHCVPVPPLPAAFSGNHYQGCSYLGLANKDGGSDQSFHVVHLQQDFGSVRAIVFSSGTGAWHCHRWSNIPCAIDLFFVHVNQSLYCTTNDDRRMLELDTATMQFSMIDLPADLCAGLPEGGREAYPVTVSMEDGRLGVVVASRKFIHVKLWVRGEDNGDGADRWVLEKEVVLQDQVRRITGLPRNRLYVAGTSRGMVFLLTCAAAHHSTFYMSLRLETMQLTMIHCIENLSPGEFYPYQTLRPPLFLNPDRLAGNVSH